MIEQALVTFRGGNTIVILEIDDIQARTVLGAMKCIATGGSGGLSEMDSRTIESAGPILMGTDKVDVASLSETSPEQLAATLRTSGDASIVAQILTIMSLVGGVLEPQKTNLLLEFAAALSVDEEYLEILNDATSGRIGRATDRLSQRGAEYFLPAQSGHADSDDPVAPLMPYGDGETEPALEERYVKLGELPEGTFGKAFFDHFSDNDLDLPATDRGQVEAFVIPHDSTHVLSGYSTDESGEILVAAFTAAMHPRKPMEAQILPAMFCWHLGIKLNWLGGSFRGAFEPRTFWDAWDRGNATRFDLFDPEWDFWAAAEQPLVQVRQSLGVADSGAMLHA